VNQTIIDLWAEIGSEAYWADLVTEFPHDIVPFKDRWPQPGFVGGHYLDSPRRIVVMGQNPRASNTVLASDSDREMFRLIRRHSEVCTQESLTQLFRMTRDFMLGVAPYKPAWKPITAVRNHLGLSLDNIAYLNLIPLATQSDLIAPVYSRAYARSTRKQLELLKPDKIVVYGKGAYTRFGELWGRSSDVRYIEQRNYSLAPGVRKWLNG
jgi:hypothetical protein